MHNEALLTMREVRERLRISRWLVQRLINEDPDFHTIKLRKRRFMSERALSDFIDAKSTKPNA